MNRLGGGDESDDSSLSLMMDESHHPLGRVPLLPEDVEIDDLGATAVFVFPRGEEEGGTVEPDEEKEDAAIEFRKIFSAEKYPDVELPTFEDEVSEGEYQEAVRATFLAILQSGGLQASSSPSIDEDEVFLKVSFGRQDNCKMLSELAEYYRCMVPVKGASYDIKTNDAGDEVPIFIEHSSAVQGVQPFRQVDEMRLLTRWVGERVNLEEMLAQGVMTRYFYATRHKDVVHLNKRWANMKWIPCLPNKGDLELVRGYFGEQIGFFFAWFGTYNKYLRVLAVAALACSARRHLAMTLGKWMLNFFAVFLVGWVAMFNELFKRKSERFKQLWGMDDWDKQQAATLPSYDEDLDGTPRGQAYKMAATSCVALYVLVFAGAILGISLVNKDMRDRGDMRLATWSPFLISGIMKVASFLWSKIAFKLVEWENHRTLGRFNNSLAWTLASVKLFVALFPFVDLAFLEFWVNETCKPTVQEAAVAVYKHSGWPEGTTLSSPPPAVPLPDSLAPNITKEDLAFLGSHSHVNFERGFTCISGCYPVKCWEETLDGQTVTRCDTNCWQDLQTQLVTFYILQVVVSLVFLIIPIILTKVSITMELAKVQKVSAVNLMLRSFFCIGSRGRSGSSSSGEGKYYSLLQFQAKCHESSPYEYASWGGSFVEDFLDLAIGYSLLACFAQVVPEMALIGTASHMIIYRILAYRMLNVTCRPYPYGAEGIGIWQCILDTIATLAVTCNVALATFLMPPIDSWPWDTKLMFFIFAEKGLFSLRALVNSVSADVPEDVVRIDDHNQKEKDKILPKHLAPVGLDQRWNFGNVDIGLSASGYMSDSDSKMPAVETKMSVGRESARLMSLGAT